MFENDLNNQGRSANESASDTRQANTDNSFTNDSSATKHSAEGLNTDESDFNANTSHSDIRYTYNNDAYNTDSGKKEKAKKPIQGNGCFISLIALLLLITVGAAAISIYTLVSFDGAQQGSAQATDPPSPTATHALDTNGASVAFDNVVEIKPTPTPTLVDGQLLTPQQAAEKLIPSVVCIQNYATNKYFGGSESSALQGEGSGIISRSDGYIITNAHVIENAASVQVVLFNGVVVDAQIIGSDSITDLALLKIDPAGLDLKVATFTSAKSLSIADTVLAVGNPGGLDFSSSVTLGIVSALDRAVQDKTSGHVMHCIQTDTAINPGNSGGPLIDLYGNVVGITSSKIVATDYENMGFAITYDEAAPIINDLLHFGYVKNRASINITLALPSSVFRVSGWSSIPTGLCITKVSGQKEADAGLKEYDIICALDGKAISSMAEYSAYLLKKKPGETVTIQLYRANISGWSVSYSQAPVTVTLELSESQ